jgi:hypothetical protein
MSEAGHRVTAIGVQRDAMLVIACGDALRQLRSYRFCERE